MTEPECGRFGDFHCPTTLPAAHGPSAQFVQQVARLSGLSAMHDAIFSATATAWAFSHMKDAVRAQPPTHPDTVLRRGGTTLALPETGHLLRSEMLASTGTYGPPRHRHIADPCRPHGSRIPRQCGPPRPRHVADQRSDRCRAHGSRIPRQGKDAGDEGDAWWRADLPALRDTPAIPLGKCARLG